MLELKLPSKTLTALRHQALSAAPNECCGLLFGSESTVSRHVPLKNVSPTPQIRFFAEPGALLRALQDADGRGDVWLAVYHSHPRGPAQLSAHDLGSAPQGVVQVLLTPDTVKAFWVAAGRATEIALVTLPS